MYQPMLINKTTFDNLTPEQQTALTEAAARAEAFYLEEGKKGDEVARQTFEEAGVEIAEMTPEDFELWLALARETAFPIFVEETPNGQELLDMALAVE